MDLISYAVIACASRNDGRAQQRPSHVPAHPHPQADRRRRAHLSGGGVGAARDGARPGRARIGKPRGPGALLCGGRARMGAARDAADQLDVAPRLMAQSRIPSWPDLSRPSTPCLLICRQDVDARHKAGHDGAWPHAASTRRKPFHKAVAAPDISTEMKRSSWYVPLSEMRGSAVRWSACSANSTPGRVVTAVL